MKKTVLLFTLIMGVTFLSYSKEKKEKVEGLVFQQTEYDYGKISHNADGLCIFKFKNEAKVPITITNVRTSCGCTSPNWPKEPIAKGKTGEIQVKYNTAIVGPFSKTITVSTSAEQTIVLRIKGEVEK